MFCSICRRVPREISECRRKICPIGHVTCEVCDDSSGICRQCNAEISSFVCIQLVNKVPRLFIQESSGASNSDQSPNSSGEASSMKQIIEDLNEYDERHCTRETTQSPRPVIGCFEVVASRPNSLRTISIDGDEESDVMRCFKVCEKSDERNISEETSTPNKEVSTKTPSKKSSIPRSIQLLSHREIQTSVTYFVGGNISSYKETNHSLCPAVSSSRLLHSDPSVSGVSYPTDYESNIGDSYVNSVQEIYRNPKANEESETAHYTSITVSPVSSSPKTSPTRGVQSIGNRVRFASVFNVDGFIAAQMEPLAVFEVDSSNLDEEIPPHRSRRLPRFPVRCPITNCDSFGVPSDFCNHITIDHPSVDIKRTAPNKLINLKVNHMGNKNMMICERLFLLTEKITNIGYGSFENCLPIVLMTTRMSIRKAFGCTSADDKSSDANFFVYLVGVYQFPVNYTLTLWAHGRDDYEPTMIKSITSSVVFMNKPISPKDVAGKALSVSSLELQKLTGNEKKMLSCQIVFH